MRKSPEIAAVRFGLPANALLCLLVVCLSACRTTENGPTPLAPTPAARTLPTAAAAIPTEVLITPTPEAVVVPIHGQRKRLPLDCEARSAVDWAAYFDVHVEEMEMQSSLPLSLFPDEGYVGDPHDDWGHVPPQSYGVHAGPVAGALRRHGLKAYPYRHLSWADLRQELDAGFPAIVWVVGAAQDVGGGQEYTAPDGRKTIVAAYEHTVILAGYQGNDVFLLDGARTYTRTLDTFLASWEVLGRMAVLANRTTDPSAEPL